MHFKISEIGQVSNLYDNNGKESYSKVVFIHKQASHKGIQILVEFEKFFLLSSLSKN